LQERTRKRLAQFCQKTPQDGYAGSKGILDTLNKGIPDKEVYEVQVPSWIFEGQSESK